MTEKIIQIATLGSNVHTQCVVCLTDQGRLFNASRYHGSDEFKWEEMTLPEGFEPVLPTTLDLRNIGDTEQN
jgi:hypothetical protein